MSIFKTKLILTEQEDSILGLVKNMVSREECLIEVDPETMDYLLSMDKLQYYLLIDSEGVQISNHDFLLFFVKQFVFGKTDLILLCVHE